MCMHDNDDLLILAENNNLEIVGLIIKIHNR